MFLIAEGVLSSYRERIVAGSQSRRPLLWSKGCRSRSGYSMLKSHRNQVSDQVADRRVNTNEEDEVIDTPLGNNLAGCGGMKALEEEEERKRGR